MRTIHAVGATVLAVLVGASTLAAAEGPAKAAPRSSAKPAPEEAEQAKELARTRAVLKIERPEGVCYWQIQGSDALARMPVKDSGYGMILLSAQIVGDKVQVSVAGENQPLETTLLGRYSLDYPGPEVEAPQKSVPAESLRFGGRDAWNFSLISRSGFFARRNKGGIDGCCTCNPYKLSCCPSAGACLGCGTCGDCCN